MDAVILRLMVEEKLGRPSTWGRLANKIFQSRVIDPDFGITERGEEWVMHAPEEFVDVEFSRAFETVLDLIDPNRSEEHTSELQSLMRISYAVFCLKKKKTYYNNNISKSNRHTSNKQKQN